MSQIMMDPIKVSIGGKLTRCEVRNKDGSIDRIIDLEKPNMIMNRCLHSICKGNVRNVFYGLNYASFSYSRLSENGEPNNKDMISFGAGLYTGTAAYYGVTSETYSNVTIVNNASTDGELSITQTASYQYPNITQTNGFTVRSIGFFGESGLETLSSRVVLEDPIFLEYDQYLVASYSLKTLLPDPRVETPFEIIPGGTGGLGTIRGVMAYRPFLSPSVEKVTKRPDTDYAAYDVWFRDMLSMSSTHGSSRNMYISNNITSLYSVNTLDLPFGSTCGMYGLSSSTLTYNNDYKRTRVGTMLRNNGQYIAIKSFFLGGYHFVLDEDSRFERYLDQTISLQFTTEWRALDAIEE